MKISTVIESGKISFICQGKVTNFLSFKTNILSTLKAHPHIHELTFSFNTHPIALNVLGFLLTLTKSHSIQILLLNYSSFRHLEDLYLLEKFNIKYQKSK